MIYIFFIIITFLLFLLTFYQWQYFALFEPVKYREDKLDSQFTMLKLKATDGTFLEGVEYSPKEFKKTIFFLGGVSQDSVGTIYELSQCYKENRILTFNYRGYGNSKGKPSEKNLYKDALHVSKIFTKHYGKFSLLGYSLGSSVASFVAHKHNVQNLFLIGAFDSVKNMAKIRYPYIPSFCIRYTFDTAKYIQNVTCDTYLIYSIDDGIVYLQSTLNLKIKIKNLIQYKELTSYNHSEIFCCDETLNLVKEVLK